MAESQPRGSSKMRQTRLLLQKNYHVSRRNLFATTFPLLIPPLFCFVVFIMGVDDRHNRNGFNAATFDVRHPTTSKITDLPMCDTIRMPGCTSPLGIVGTLTSDAQAVIDIILAAHPDVAPDVTYYGSSAALNNELLAHPQKVLAAVHFDDAFSLAKPKYILQYNTTRACLLGAFSCNDPPLDVGIPLQLAVEGAIITHGARNQRSDSSLSVSIDVGVSEFPHPEMEPYQRDITKLYAPLIIFVAVSFNFFIQVNQLATEKDLKLKLQMRVMGTHDGPMWLSWFLVFVGFSTFSALVLCLSCHIFNFDFITRSDFGIYFILFWLTYLAHTSFACFISSLSSRANSARAKVGAFIFPVIFFYSYFDAVFYTDLCPPIVATICSLFPPFLFMKAITDLIGGSSFGGSATPAAGFRWDDRFDNAFDCPLTCTATIPGCKCRYGDGTFTPTYIFPFQEVYLWLFWEFIIYFVLALYFEQITTSPGFGSAQPWYYVLTPSYWTGSEAMVSSAAAKGDVSTDETDEGVTLSQDVAEEQARVLATVNGTSGTAANGYGDAIRIVNLKKTFQKNGCSKPFTAVCRVNLGIPDDQLFCLLGHNGAGKTTTFNMLSGIFEPTRGDAFIFGKSVRRQLRGVQALMGLCPQHDVLWGELTADEHLQLFAGLSGVPEPEVPRRIDTFLSQVDLQKWRNVPCQKYSGGMKRRLSVANALIADPKVVYLDEPTTGMDPVNRRGVWDVIEKAKKGRVVVLTTHAMEEAETLGDRIGIMSRGRLLCLGSTLHLKSDYGSGYTVDVSCPMEAAQQVLQVVQKHAPSAKNTGRGIVAKVPQADSLRVLPPLYSELEQVKQSVSSLDTALNMCTLEEVFIQLAEEAQDPEWLLLKYGEVEKLRWWEKCIPSKVKAHKAQVADYEARKAAGTQGTELAAGEVGSNDDPEEEEVLRHTLGFKATQFKVQQKALSKKNQQFQEKQKNQQNACSACTLYPLAFVFIAESIFSLVIGQPYIECNVTDTTPNLYSTFDSRPGVSSLNLALTNPNYRVTTQLITDLQYMSNARNYTEKCTNQFLSDCNAGSNIGECSALELENPPVASENELYEAYNFRIPSAVCAHRPGDQLAESIGGVGPTKDERFAYLLEQSGCNMSTYWEMHAKYEYMRNEPTEQEYCMSEGRPNLTVSYVYAGNDLVEAGVNLGCNEAVELFKRTCNDVKRPPTLCPRNLTKAEEEEEAATNIGALLGFGGSPTIRAVLELDEKFLCSADAAERIEGFPTGQFFGLRAISESAWHAVECMSARMCARGGTVCPNTADKLATFGALGSAELAANGGSWPTCASPGSGSSGANPAAEAVAFQTWISSAATDTDTFNEDFACMFEAYSYCRVSEAVTQCPGLVAEALPKKIPFSASPSLTAAEISNLGSLRYDPSSLDPAACGATCFDSMMQLTPVESSGVLQRFNIESGDDEISRGLSYLDVDCIKWPKSGGPCAVTREEMDGYLYEHWGKSNRTDINWLDKNSPLWFVAAFQEGAYQGALHFDAFSLADLKFDYTVLYNGTFWPSQLVDELGFGGFFKDSEISALMHRMHAAIYKEVTNLPTAELEGSTMSFPAAGGLFAGLNFTRLIAPIMLTFLATILYPLICWAIVSEKSAKLREIMVMSGLQRRPYWIINYMHWFTLYLVQMLVTFLFCNLFPRVGAAAAAEPGVLGFKLFTNHDPMILILLWFLYGLANTSFSFFFSTLVADKYVAIIVPFFIIEICGITAYILTDNAIQVGGNGGADLILAGLLPMYAFTNALQILSAATGDASGKNGVRLTLGGLGGDGIYAPITAALWTLLFDFVLYTFLFVYCDMVLPVGPGVKHHPLFFLKREFWKPESAMMDIASCKKKAEPGEGPDVTAERDRVTAPDAATTDQVRCLGLNKIYPKAASPAVVNVQFGIKHRECFGLLGSNGAGKSTTIHILCGLHAPTEGTVLVKAPDCPELDIRKDLTTIQSAMGVCPQDNLLWDDLNGDQHLQFFGRLRGLGEKVLKKHIGYWLKRVNLATRSTKKKPSKAYSGGMKRRLSVACSFVGNPRLVYLDEPSTGLDPESRRQLWYAIRAAKRDKSIILTTHALEEADALCDRIGIMTLGQMRVVGSPTELRMRFDQGYTLLLAAAMDKQQATEDLVLSLAPQAQLRDAINGVRVYSVQKSQVQIGALFEAIESRKGELGIKDWGLSQTSLEEVFLTIVAATAGAGSK